MNRLRIGVIGLGWFGEIHCETIAGVPTLELAALCTRTPERLKSQAEKFGVKKTYRDYRDMLADSAIDAVSIVTMWDQHTDPAIAALEAGKHVFLEKPIALELHEADELNHLAKKNNLKFSIGYSQRFNPKFAYVRQSLRDGTLGRPVSALVSRHIGRGLGKKITGRTKLSPAAMEATHDLDFVMWCLQPAKPIRVYSTVNYGAMKESTGADIPDTQYITVTFDNGVSCVVCAGWSLPPAYPNFSMTWIEMIGTEGALIIDDTHRDTQLTTMKTGIVHPMSTMPGEPVAHTYAGPMAAETVHFVEAVACDRPVLVTGEEARQVMEVYIAADLSAERHEPVSLPLPESRPAVAAVR